ncbi:MAG: hypothetical protein WDW19_05695 [Neisseriaceae bacterium]
MENIALIVAAIAESAPNVLSENPGEKESEVGMLDSRAKLEDGMALLALLRPEIRGIADKEDRTECPGPGLATKLLNTPADN